MSDDPVIIDSAKLLDCFHDKQKVTMRRMLFLYGGDINEVLNALHAMAARLAIGTGVAPDVFAGAMQYHWDAVANHVNAAAPDGEERKLDS